jgi:hypothetical protein
VEKFYGAWNVRLDHIDSHFPGQRFSISGSDNTDGLYEVSLVDVVNLTVTGIAWFISFEIDPIPFLPGEQIVQRATRFEAPDGLIVQLDKKVVGTKLSLMSLTCISMDPALNPNPAANPYDFTIPEH